VPQEVFLTGLSVEGFRGIGKKVSVPLRPGAGLTVITGRNGSGKSSLAESIELLLTGDNARWADKKKNSELRKGWRNLHHPGPTQIEVELSAVGMPMIALTRKWASDDLESGTSTVQHLGKEPVALNTLGWDQALKTYRPFLSYGELGGLMEDGPSRLHDAISNILGLEEFTAIKASLADRKSAWKAKLKASKDAWTLLAAELGGSSDPRAEAIVVATAKKSFDPISVEALLAGGDEGNESLAGWCRSIGSLSVLSLDAVAQHVLDARNAFEAVGNLAGSGAQTALATAKLLQQAIALHDGEHTGDCPVCGTQSVLTDSWVASAEADIARLLAEATAASEAANQLVAAERGLRQFMPTAPLVLAQRPALGLQGEAAQRAESSDAESIGNFGAVVAEVRSRWAESLSMFQTADLASLLIQAEPVISTLNTELVALQSQALKELEAADSEWTPLARRLRAWCIEASELSNGAAAVKDLTAAEDWVSELSGEVRDQRLAPIRTAVEVIWDDLRCDSNITLSGFELTGSGTRRRVQLELSVDNTPAPTLGVLSQGEMHALALSLFLPRASLDESPFRFLVIDDPVQAMDPSKVDGLARQLAKAAETRQVIVLTHDDRLPEAVRRLGIDARVLEVVRGTKSGVRIETSIDPTERRLKDARDLSKDTKLPADIARQVVGAQCRQALEAECIDLIQTRMFRAGTSGAKVDEALDATKTLNDLLSLLIMNDPRKLDEALILLDNEVRGAREIIKLVQGNTHGAAQGRSADTSQAGSAASDPGLLVAETRKLVKALRNMEHGNMGHA
jgi:recombinational DNA repair ATPase RecF